MDLAKYAGNKIKLFRKEKNWTQEELARKLGVGSTSVTNYESGYRSPNQDMLFKLSEVFDVSINEFFPKQEETVVVHRPNTDLIPIVGKIAAGTPNYAVEDIIGYMSLPPHKQSSEGLVYLEVTSDSMDRKFPVGSYVLIDRGAQVENGDVAAVKINGEEATLKQVKFEEDDEVMLIPQSTNPNYYPVRLNVEQDEVAIIGKAIGVYSSI